MAEKKLGDLMIVDDNEGVRHLVSRWLERAGFTVSQAKDGAEAMEIIRKAPPDVVLADIRMPKINGLELARMIKRDFPAVKVVLMTAYSSPQTIAQAKREGVDDYLEKPFTQDQVEKTARQVMER
jgi:CheY-like chemotaxis protein